MSQLFTSSRFNSLSTSLAEKTADNVASLKDDWSCVDWSDTVILTATCLMEIVPHEGNHGYKMYAGDDDEDFLLPYRNTSKL